MACIVWCEGQAGNNIDLLMDRDWNDGRKGKGEVERGEERVCRCLTEGASRQEWKIKAQMTHLMRAKSCIKNLKTALVGCVI
jgi:hypothetical protein